MVLVEGWTYRSIEQNGGPKNKLTNMLNWFFTEVQKQFLGERITFPTNSATATSTIHRQKTIGRETSATKPRAPKVHTHTFWVKYQDLKSKVWNYKTQNSFKEKCAVLLTCVHSFILFALQCSVWIAHLWGVLTGPGSWVDHLSQRLQ